MPSSLHDGILLLFRNRPDLAPALAVQVFGLPVPKHWTARFADSALPQLVPPALSADAVIVLERAPEGTVAWVYIIEVQHQRDEDKRYTWPLYAAQARKEHRAPTTLFVVAPDPEVAEWAALPIETGQPGSPWVPKVLTAADVPFVRDVETARANPEMAVLSTVAHGGEPGAEELAAVALSVLADDSADGLDSERVSVYTDLVMSALSPLAREALEARMASGTYEFQSDFARKYIALGKEKGRGEGREEGRGEGRVSSLLAVLSARGLRLSEEQRTRITSCTDIPTLDRWITRAATAMSTDEVVD